MVLEKDGEDHVDRERVKRRSITQSEGERNILHTINRRKGNWIGHILCRICLLKHVNEGEIQGMLEVTGRG